jgi:hypothetical protein
MKLALPSLEELTLTIERSDGEPHTIDPVDIMDMMRTAAKLADSAGRPNDWKTDFVELYERKYGYQINRTQAVLIIEQCKSMTDVLVKKLPPSQKQSDSTVVDQAASE